MSKRKKRRKLKKNVKYFICFLFVIIIIFFVFFIFVKHDNSNKIDGKFDDILNKIENDNIDKSFLNWYSNNYDIDKLISYLNKYGYNDKLWHELSGKSLIVLKDLQSNVYESMSNLAVIDNKKDNFTFSFIGDVSLADNWYIMPEYDKRGKGIDGILDKSVIDIMTKSDVMIANNEFTISDRGEKMKGKYYTFRGSPKRLPIYKEMGVDLVTLANNHVYDFGSVAFNDMLDALKEYDMPYIGAGKNIDEASRPYYYVSNGYKIGFVNATRAEKYILTPGATEDSEGVFRCYDTERLVNVIKEVKNNSDYVVLLIHWGKEDSHELEQVQIDTSKDYINAGADIIVGSHAHVLQGFEFYNNKFISYNLGDFIFNNETKDTGILQISLNNDGNFVYSFVPCLESNEYTKLLTGDKKDNLFEKMKGWSRGDINISNNGIISNNN
ncbi:MAG: CapA family protein [Bacilli bacterium]|nr:CapA family protein [Bacilli bacterium]